MGEANERAETWELEAAELQQKVDASQLEIAQTDSLIDTLDEKLAAARMDATTGTLAEGVTRADGASSAGEESIVACCPATMRCEEMERAAEAARAKTHGASEHEYAQLHEEWQFLDRLARRARHALTWALVKK